MLSILALSLVATGSLVAAGPCDIYGDGGTPCVAAHSTTRALYKAYSGSLYEVRRGSDGATQNIGPLSAGGVADAKSQDDFCENTTCLITRIYDQSGTGNDLTQAPGGGFPGPDVGGSDNLAAPIGAPVTLNGQKAYGVFSSPGTGYRNNAAKKTATGDGAEGMYAVLDGTHYNDRCCFDYGNGETTTTDPGNGHMEALYFGSATGWGTGSGNGPWIMADLENGLFSGADPKNNPDDPTITSRFVTAIIKGQANEWAIRGGDGASGGLSTYYHGKRPNADGYNPMSKEGAIILGVGGDNSPGAQGTFYEGVMTSGYPSDDTENAVQADIVAAGYAAGAMTSGPQLTVGSSITLRATSACCTNRYISHDGANIITTDGSSSTWTIRTGLGNSACISFESADTPGSFIRHRDYQLHLDGSDGSKQFNEDATFCPQAGLNGQGTSLRVWGYPARYFRHYNSILYIASNGGVHDFDATGLFNDDVSWAIGSA